MLLTARKFLQAKIIDTENHLRGLLRNFGLKVGAVTRAQFERRVGELLGQSPHLALTITPLLDVRRVLHEQYLLLHGAMKKLAADDGICRLLMSAPGVGPVVALTFRAGVDEPARFARSRAVPAHFGLAPARYQSGELDRSRGISKCGDAGVRWAFRGGWRHPAAQDPTLALEGLGHGDRQAPRTGAGHGCRGTTLEHNPAPDVGRSHRVSLGGAARVIWHTASAQPVR